MLETLIFAYRSRFYSGGLKKAGELIKKNKGLFFLLLIIALGFIATIVCSWYFNLSWMMLIPLAIEIGFIVVGDNILVKKYKTTITKESGHLKDVIIFLEKDIADYHLYNETKINELIDRLTLFINECPLHTGSRQIAAFSKTIILPIITFVAGVYINDIRKIETLLVFNTAWSLIIFLLLVWIILKLLRYLLQKVLFKNYNAAVAFREDLLDIRLMLFSSGSNNKKLCAAGYKQGCMAEAYFNNKV